ncbi:MAG: GHKL domain-containing protein [Oscillatoriales cyanobacterium SM2_2_1]|nr:GHKL domain-containing protein [Oscillatoriales cyanobacterium SM2_2_1]
MTAETQSVSPIHHLPEGALLIWVIGGSTYHHQSMVQLLGRHFSNSEIEVWAQLPPEVSYIPDLVIIDQEFWGCPLPDDDFAILWLLTADHWDVHCWHQTPSPSRQVDFIHKPIDSRELLMRAQRLLQSRYHCQTLQAQNQNLEHSIQERTNALTLALENLQRTQLQVVQNEKLSSMGQLLAGIAHEMNNPLSAILNGADLLRESSDAVLEHLSLYRQFYPDPVEAIALHAEVSDLDYLIEDIPPLLQSLQTASERLRQMTSSLRTFSRADADRRVPFQVHEGIDSTLMLLRHRLKSVGSKPRIDVIRDYSDIPSYHCYAGQLNQVFMNLLANAIDALEENGIPDPCIWISTRVNAEDVVICIRDNARGISPEVLARIFEPLFTTKSVGKGTGLGLAICKQIIEERHGGALTCSSSSLGTEFTIRLPLDSNDD